MDEEELEAIKKESMQDLFMGFRIETPEEKAAKAQQREQKKARKPRSDGISEDSLEDQMSNLSQDGRLGMPGNQHTRGLSIDTDTILKN